MLENSFKRSTEEPTQNGCAYLGEGITFKGSISVPEKVVIHGTLEGDIDCRELIIGPKGVVKGNVRVDHADVHGKILECAEIKMLLVVRKTGRVDGAVTYRELEIEKGGVIAGQFAVVGEGEKVQSETQTEPAGDHSSRNRPRVVPLEPWSDPTNKQAIG